MKDYIKIENIEKNDRKLNIRFSTSDKLKKFFKTLNFWIEYDFEIGEISNSILVVPFIANIMPIVNGIILRGSEFFIFSFVLNLSILFFS